MGMQTRKLSADLPMSGVPSEMEDNSTRDMHSQGLFGEARNLHAANSSVFTSSPAMKPSLSLNTLKRTFEESNDIWGRIDGTAMEWDMRSPENVELAELDDMLDDF